MERLEELITEDDLIEKFGLAEKGGRSRIISGWIRKGLKHIEISGKRLFREEDIVNFFDKLLEGSKDDKVRQ
jgi:hypothetical protein